MRKKDKKQIPTVEELKEELKNERHKHSFARVARNTLYSLIVVAAISTLIVTLWMPVFRIQGSSMSPSLEEGQIVVALKGGEIKQGDLVAFYMGNKLLIKRVIAGPSDVVVMHDDGTVFVNGTELDEPYVTEKALGECDIEFPYQVPETRYFMLGDQRKTSVDSRNDMIGCVSEEQLVGKIVFVCWPFEKFGTIK